jgi:hypothetical protein
VRKRRQEVVDKIVSEVQIDQAAIEALVASRPLSPKSR